MDSMIYFTSIMYGIAIIIAIPILIFLIRKRLRDKKEERFEKRDF